MHKILCFYLHNFQESKKDKHNMVTEKQFHWAILKIHTDTTCDLSHMWTKKHWPIFFHYTCIMNAFSVLNRTH
jgi:hypothetical protein